MDYAACCAAPDGSQWYKACSKSIHKKLAEYVCGTREAVTLPGACAAGSAAALGLRGCTSPRKLALIIFPQGRSNKHNVSHLSDSFGFED